MTTTDLPSATLAGSSEFGSASDYAPHAPVTPVQPQPAKAPAKARATKGATGDGPNRTLIRRIAQTTLEMESASASRREMLASLLGVRKGIDTVGLVIALQSAEGSAAPITALLAIAEESDPIEAVMVATEMAEDRDKAKAIWAILTSLNEVKGSMPPATARIGGQIVKAAQGLGKESRAELAALRDLLR